MYPDLGRTQFIITSQIRLYKGTATINNWSASIATDSMQTGGSQNKGHIRLRKLVLLSVNTRNFNCEHILCFLLSLVEATLAGSEQPLSARTLHHHHICCRQREIPSLWRTWTPPHWLRAKWTQMQKAFRVLDPLWQDTGQSSMQCGGLHVREEGRGREEGEWTPCGWKSWGWN